MNNWGVGTFRYVIYSFNPAYLEMTQEYQNVWDKNGLVVYCYRDFKKHREWKNNVSVVIFILDLKPLL